jgi:hypothetical protein
VKCVRYSRRRLVAHVRMEADLHSAALTLLLRQGASGASAMEQERHCALACSSQVCA